MMNQLARPLKGPGKSSGRARRCPYKKKDIQHLKSAASAAQTKYATEIA
jgi:hypothetical protein